MTLAMWGVLGAFFMGLVIGCFLGYELALDDKHFDEHSSDDPKVVNFSDKRKRK